MGKKIETELKFKIANLKSFKKRLISCGYQMIRPRTYELSVMYDNRSGLMQQTNGRIRLRQSGELVELAYKRPIPSKGIKQEIEHEVIISKLDTMQDILNAMGFNETTSYERYRTTYTKDNLKLTIDEYPFANFLEIEGNRNSILVHAVSLGFPLAENLTDPCDTLFTRWRESRGLKPVKHMRFDDYKQ